MANLIHSPVFHCVRKLKTCNCHRFAIARNQCGEEKRKRGKHDGRKKKSVRKKTLLFPFYGYGKSKYLYLPSLHCDILECYFISSGMEWIAPVHWRDANACAHTWKLQQSVNRMVAHSTHTRTQNENVRSLRRLLYERAPDQTHTPGALGALLLLHCVTDKISFMRWLQRK